MQNRICWIGIPVAFLMIGTPLSGQEESFTWSHDLAAGQSLSVEGIAGNIRAVLSTDGMTRVVAEKRGRRGDFELVQIVVDEHRDGVVICAHYGDDRERVDSCDDHDHDDWDGGHRRSIDVRVDFEVQVPAGVYFDGSMVSGDVWVEDLQSDVTANSVSGDVEVSTSGVAEANTVSGSIDVSMGSSDWSRLSYNTVSGDITVFMPEDIGTEVRFESLSGDLDSDFRISMDRNDRRWVGSRIRGTIGDGSRTLSLQTVSGDVRLRPLRR